MRRIKFTEDHEWLLPDEDGNVTVGITDYAQEQLGDIVFIELPEVGSEIITGDEAAVVESVKAAGDIRAPLNGTVCEINDALVDAPEKVNKDPMGEGWFFKITPNNPEDIDALMDEDAYWEYVSGL
ncbi:MAG: glycine cleavage system protein H [Gammaproteobacteria bacterium RBG_16_51_14]|nr:MAG: glycine cleavage system protein H [Gammaproteobacteria bacterium RBG_16_51_14]